LEDLLYGSGRAQATKASQTLAPITYQEPLAMEVDDHELLREIESNSNHDDDNFGDISASDSDLSLSSSSSDEGSKAKLPQSKLPFKKHKTSGAFGTNPLKILQPFPTQSKQVVPS